MKTTNKCSIILNKEVIDFMDDKATELELSEKQIHEIEKFVFRKREQIMRVLFAEGEITQGQLAENINSTVSSVSNILLKFDQFKYKLLNCDSRGVRKYYSLSVIGMAYMQHLSDKSKVQKDDSFNSANGAYLLQEARRTYKYFQDKMDEDGEIRMEDTLLRLSFCIDNDSTSEDVEKFLNYMYCLEKLIIMNNDVYFDKALQLIQSNILRNWIIRFLEGFYLFLPILNLLEEKTNILVVFTVLENIAKGQLEEAFVIVKEKQWEISCESLAKFLKMLKKSGRSQNDIYRILYGCMPDKMELAAMITRIICS